MEDEEYTEIRLLWDSYGENIAALMNAQDHPEERPEPEVGEDFVVDQGEGVRRVWTVRRLGDDDEAHRPA